MMPDVRRKLLLWGVASTGLACFVDHGAGASASASSEGSTTGEGATISTGPATTSDPSDSSGSSEPTTRGTSTSGVETTTAGVPGRCGDGILDPETEACDDGNADDDDACLSSCVAAACGDGVVWIGQEECDEGAANDAETGGCRPTCKLPACGDGSIYLGPLGPPIDVGGGPDEAHQSDDSPRAIAVAGTGTFGVVWSSGNAIRVQRIGEDGAFVGGWAEIAPINNHTVRDPTLAMGDAGEIAVAWEAGNLANEFFLSRMTPQGGVVNSVQVQSMGLSNRRAASVAIADDGAVFVAFLAGNNEHIYLRRFVDFEGEATAPEVQISGHAGGAAEPPTLARAADGSVVVAWGDPDGSIRYRRVAADGVMGAVVATGLRLGTGNAPPGSKRWSGVAVDPVDQRVTIAGDTADRADALQRFGADDRAGAIAVASESPPQHTPIVDLAVDAWGNLAIAWTACGGLNPIADCSAATNESFVRWFYADLTPYQPPTAVASAPGGPRPIGVAIAPDGATGLAYALGVDAFIRIAAPLCP